MNNFLVFSEDTTSFLQMIHFYGIWVIFELFFFFSFGNQLDSLFMGSDREVSYTGTFRW